MFVQTIQSDFSDRHAMFDDPGEWMLREMSDPCRSVGGRDRRQSLAASAEHLVDMRIAAERETRISVFRSRFSQRYVSALKKRERV